MFGKCQEYVTSKLNSGPTHVNEMYPETLYDKNNSKQMNKRISYSYISQNNVELLVCYSALVLYGMGKCNHKGKYKAAEELFFFSYSGHILCNVLIPRPLSHGIGRMLSTTKLYVSEVFILLV